MSFQEPQLFLYTRTFYVPYADKLDINIEKCKRIIKLNEVFTENFVDLQILLITNLMIDSFIDSIYNSIPSHLQDTITIGTFLRVNVDKYRNIVAWKIKKILMSNICTLSTIVGHKIKSNLSFLMDARVLKKAIHSGLLNVFCHNCDLIIADKLVINMD